MTKGGRWIMSGKLSQAGIQNAADTIGCDVPAVRAVIAVETGGSGFFDDGRPKILFERHVFRRLTQAAWDEKYPDISNAQSGGYNDPSYVKLYTALQLDADAAVQSCSWGLGQIMGYHWKLCGEKSLLGFLLAMHHNEDSQLALMAQFIIASGMAGPLMRHEWSTFAKMYNGSAFAKNAYDTKLAAAYLKAKTP